MNVRVDKEPNSAECIRCGGCVAACRANGAGALSVVGFHKQKRIMKFYEKSDILNL